MAYRYEDNFYTGHDNYPDEPEPVVCLHATISDLMDLLSDCQAEMRHALINRKHPYGPHFGILVHDDPLARLYQKRNRFARTLAAKIRARAAALEAENAQLRAELSECIAGGNDYTGAILADDEAGMMLAAGQGG